MLPQRGISLGSPPGKERWGRRCRHWGSIVGSSMGVRRRVVAVMVLMSALALPRLALPGRASIRRQLPPTAAPRTDWPTFHYSLDRRGVNPAETLISARTAPKLALDWSAPVGGDIGGSPLV